MHTQTLQTAEGPPLGLGKKKKDNLVFTIFTSLSPSSIKSQDSKLQSFSNTLLPPIVASFQLSHK